MAGLSPFAIAPAYGSTGTPTESASVTPTYTVATFSLLPSAATAGQRCTVTGESGLTGVVVVNTAANTWEIETVTCAESAIPALGASADTWYSSGGITVTAADGCWLYESTYGRALRWWPAAGLGSDGAWVLPSIYPATKSFRGWLNGNEDNATLTATLLAQGIAIATSAGGGATSVDSTTNAGYITIGATNPGAGATAVALIQLPTDTGFTSATGMYLSMIARVSVLTGNQAFARIGIYDGAKRYDFVIQRSGGALTLDGRWADGTASPQTALTEQVAGDRDCRSADVLMEILKIGTACQIRLNGGVWSTLNAPAQTTTSQIIQIRVEALNNGSTAASWRVKRLTAVRFA